MGHGRHLYVVSDAVLVVKADLKSQEAGAECVLIQWKCLLG